jgi:LmbE family N-acetylglucosaminyl deacetylase/glycosyltransferase involved in cell wall biosynthesis
VKEDELIPYEATDLSAGKILVLAAHPDDEVLGAGGTIALAAERGSTIRVWIATDGTAQEGVAEVDAAEAGVRRRGEARQAAAALGIPPPAFGGLADRALAASAELLEKALAAEVALFEPDVILCPSPAEIHPDHRALSECLYRTVARSRPGDPDHDRYRFLNLAFYEISQPFLPNTLVDIAPAARRKDEAVAAYASQQSVRDYAGALQGLNAYRRLTLPGSGPVEAFRVLAATEAFTRSLEEFRRSIGPAVISDGSRGPAPVAVVVRTRNRPALLAEALASLQAQTARPTRVVIVNDGGASVRSIADSFRDAFEVELAELSARIGRSGAANRGVEAAAEDLVSFLDDDDLAYPDHLERLLGAFRAGPEPVVYSDAVTALYRRAENGWKAQARTLQYSLDFDPEYLLLSNYIPLHTLVLPRGLYLRLGGFDASLDFSEDWDFLIRASFETSFRHVRAVTCEYRVFEDADPAHAAAGSAEFQKARREIYARYASRRTEEGVAQALDRMRAQIADWYERDGVSQGELRYQRESHRRLAEALARAEGGLAPLRTRLATFEARLAEEELRVSQLQKERARVLAENELVHDRLAEVFAKNEEYGLQLAGTYGEIDRLNSLLNQIYRSKTWKLHLLFERLRGRE